MSKLQVYAVGDLVKDVVEGDYVLVDPNVLSKGLLIPLVEDKQVLLVSYFDIVHIW